MYPSFQPVRHPISSARMMTCRAGAPRATARRSLSVAGRASTSLIVLVWEGGGMEE
ncbi:hypothetical protein IMZ48_35645 [Candidatus Bathyarchaeota archaeon]|nr:hypothetical protein [Candidatus Bathyarchaeota archaeon]